MTTLLPCGALGMHRQICKHSLRMAAIKSAQDAAKLAQVATALRDSGVNAPAKTTLESTMRSMRDDSFAQARNQQNDMEVDENV